MVAQDRIVAQQRTAAVFGIHAESPCFLGNDPAFGQLNSMHRYLVPQRAATAVRIRWPLRIDRMAGRIEVLHNGRRVCMPGINGDGVLCAIVNCVKHADQETKYDLSVTGLGQYHPAHRQSQHVDWPVPDIGIGDEITIRILPPGDFDTPDGMMPSPQKSINDSLFGRLQYYINVWVGSVAFSNPPLKEAVVNLVAPESGPLESQRRAFQEFGARHGELWPQIAEALVRCHVGISSVAELEKQINPRMYFIMQDDDGSVSIRYSIRGDPRGREYVMTFRDWQIAEVYPVD